MYGYGYQYSTNKSGNPGKDLALAYKARVIADAGIYENNTCLVRFLNKIIQE